MRNRVFNLLSIIATPRIFFFFRPKFVKKKKKKSFAVRELFKSIPLHRINKKVTIISWTWTLHFRFRFRFHSMKFLLLRNY